MKFRIVSFTVIFVLITAIFSCENFLTENPKSSIAPTNFYSTSEDAIAAVNGIYDVVTQFAANGGGVYFNNYWLVQGLASDNMIANEFSDETRLAQFDFGPQNGPIEQIWRDSYSAINVANLAIQKIPPIEMDENLKNRLLGEARFLRAIIYFDLVRMFGGNIPSPLEPANQVDTAPHLEPSTNDDIYNQIINDLEFAEANLVAEYDVEKGRATSGAATAMLARVYLFQENWENVVIKTQEVMSSGRYELWGSYRDVFQIENNNGKEAIFSINFWAEGSLFWESGQFNTRFLPNLFRNGEGPTNGQEWELPSMDLYNSFKKNDERHDVSFFTSFTYSDGETVTFEPHISKYWDREDEPNGSDSSNDFQYIRYADVLLMFAEASNELSGPTTEAYNALNAVRNRAGLDDLSDLSQEEFRQAVWQERRWEFAIEGQRWFDLVRTGQLIERVNGAKPDATPEEYHILFPIPQRELDQNPNLTQNPGYE